MQTPHRPAALVRVEWSPPEQPGCGARKRDGRIGTCQRKVDVNVYGSGGHFEPTRRGGLCNRSKTYPEASRMSSEALERLRAVYARARQRPDFRERVAARDEVLQRYQPVFRPDRLKDLAEDTFRSFLYFENNKHWTGLHRQVGVLTKDMDRLRSALAVLLDEGQPLPQRFTQAVNMVKGMGKALASAVLLVAYPDRYGVWNSTSESALQILNIWPEFEPKMSVGEKYERLNKLFLQLARDLEVDLWTLDWIWWELVTETEEDSATDVSLIMPSASEQRFRLEVHLHDFLVTNWDSTELGREWAIYSTDDDPLAGSEFPTGVGQVDILARHRTRPGWLVVELKRGRPADHVLGQLLRYIGWVKNHLAKDGEEVEGLIIAEGVDSKLLYGIRGLVQPSVSVMQYRVEFHLERLNLTRGE